MRDRDARVVGWLVLMYLPDRFIASGDAAATTHAIAGNEFLFRLMIVGDLVGAVIWLLVVLALYRLFEDVDRSAAVLMVIPGAFMQAPLFFVGAVNDVAAYLPASGCFRSASWFTSRDFFRARWASGSS